MPSPPERKLADPMSVLEPRPMPNELQLDSKKRLMLVSGRANPELAARIGSKLGVDLSP